MPPRPRLGEIPSHNAVPHGLKWAQLLPRPHFSTAQPSPARPSPSPRLLPTPLARDHVSPLSTPRGAQPAGVHTARAIAPLAASSAAHGRTVRTVFHPLSESSESPRLTAGPCRPCDHVSRSSTVDPPKQPAPGSNTLTKFFVSRSPRQSAKHASLWRSEPRKEVRRKPKSRADSPPGARST